MPRSACVAQTVPAHPNAVEPSGLNEQPGRDESSDLALRPPIVTPTVNNASATGLSANDTLIAQPAVYGPPSDGASRQRPIINNNQNSASATGSNTGSTPDSAAGGCAGRMGRVGSELCPTSCFTGQQTPRPPPSQSELPNNVTDEPVRVIRVCFWDVIPDDPFSLELIQRMQPLIDSALEETLLMVNQVIPITHGQIIDTPEKYHAARAILPFCPYWQCGVSSPEMVLCFSKHEQLRDHHTLIHGGVPTEGYRPNLNVPKTARLLKLLTRRSRRWW